MYPLANMARKVLETFLAFKFPQYQQDSLYTSIRELSGVDKNEKERLIRFLDAMAHSDNVERVHDFPPNSVEEKRLMINGHHWNDEDLKKIGKYCFSYTWSGRNDAVYELADKEEGRGIFKRT